jgi:spore coat protein CotH
MANYALVDNESCQIINIVVWDGVSQFSIDGNFTAVLMPENCIGGIGGTYKDGEFTAPPPVVSVIEEAQQPHSTGTQTL